MSFEAEQVAEIGEIIGHVWATFKSELRSASWRESNIRELLASTETVGRFMASREDHLRFIRALQNQTKPVHINQWTAVRTDSSVDKFYHVYRELDLARQVVDRRIARLTPSKPRPLSDLPSVRRVGGEIPRAVSSNELDKEAKQYEAMEKTAKQMLREEEVCKTRLRNCPDEDCRRSVQCDRSSVELVRRLLSYCTAQRRRDTPACKISEALADTSEFFKLNS